MRIGFYIVFLDFLRSASFVVPCQYLNNNALIAFIAYIGHASGVLIWIWTAAIAQTLYQIVMSNKNQYRKNERYWIFLCLLICLIHLVSLFFPVFGSESSICTFNFTLFGECWRLLGIYLPQAIFIAYTLFCYIKTYIEIKRFPLSIDHKTTIQRLFIFNILQFITYIPISIVDVLQFFTYDCTLTLIFTISFSLYTMHGLFGSLAYIWVFNAKDKETNDCFSSSDQTSNLTGSEVNLLLETVDQ